MLSCYEGFEFKQADTQLDGMYDIRAYRKWILSRVNRKADVEILREFDEAVADLEDDEPDSALHFGYRFACESIASDFVRLFNGGIDTCRPESWATLHDMVVCASRLATRPMYKFEAAAYEYVWCVAGCIDVMTRLADVSVRAMAPLDFSDGNELRKRASFMFADIMLGRGVAWLRIIDDLLMQSAMACGVDGRSVLDAVCVQRRSSYCDSLSDLFGRLYPDTDIDVDAFYSYHVTQYASLWDLLQQRTYFVTFDGDFDDVFDASDFASVCHSDIYDEFENGLVRMFQGGEALAGYAKMFGLCAPFNVMCVPMSDIIDTVSTYDSYVEALNGSVSLG